MAPTKRGSSLDMHEMILLGIPALFCLLMSCVLGPLVMSEPYGRTLVGARLDTGSKLFSLLFPGALFGIFVLVGVGSTIYFLFSGAKKYPAFADFWNRFLPAAPHQSKA